MRRARWRRILASERLADRRINTRSYRRPLWRHICWEGALTTPKRARREAGLQFPQFEKDGVGNKSRRRQFGAAAGLMPTGWWTEPAAVSLSSGRGIYLERGIDSGRKRRGSPSNCIAQVEGRLAKRLLASRPRRYAPTFRQRPARQGRPQQARGGGGICTNLTPRVAISRPDDILPPEGITLPPPAQQDVRWGGGFLKGQSGLVPTAPPRRCFTTGAPGASSRGFLGYLLFQSFHPPVELHDSPRGKRQIGLKLFDVWH